MTWAERKRARWGNTMADFTFEAFLTQAIDCGGLAFFENPEDLRALKRGEHRGIRPASMWQWEEFERLLEHEGIETVTFYQQDFGTQYLKPTRLLLGNFLEQYLAFCHGSPAFDDPGFYQGPLQPRTAQTELVGASSAGFCYKWHGTVAI